MRNQHARIAQLAGIIDRFTLLSGHWVAWLLMVMVIIQSLVVVFRYVFDVRKNILREVSLELFPCIEILS